MKTRMKFLLSIGAALPLIGIGPIIVSAQSFDEARLQSIFAASEQAAVEETTTESTTEQQPTAEEAKNSEKRIKERKEAQKTKLAAAEQQRLKVRCKSSQGKISSVGGRINGVETSHNKVHANLVDRLTKLSDKLKAKNVDTTQLNTQITELKAKIAKFNTDLAAYKVATSDLSAMDCATDPTGFKATLEAARTQLATLRQDAKDIRAYVNDVIKPTLQVARKQLDPKATDTAVPTTNPTTDGGTQ